MMLVLLAVQRQVTAVAVEPYSIGVNFFLYVGKRGTSRWGTALPISRWEDRLHSPSSAVFETSLKRWSKETSLGFVFLA